MCPKTNCQGFGIHCTHVKKGLLTLDCFLQAIFPFPVMFSNTLDADMFKSLPNVKSLDWSKVKTFADNKINVNEKLFWFEKGRKLCGKRRKCWLSMFSPFPTMFSKALHHRIGKSRACGKEF